MFKNGGSGTVRIMDGSTLEEIADDSYDFCIRSHYLEHPINPFKALPTMRCVLDQEDMSFLSFYGRRRALIISEDKVQ